MQLAPLRRGLQWTIYAVVVRKNRAVSDWWFVSDFFFTVRGCTVLILVYPQVEVNCPIA